MIIAAPGDATATQIWSFLWFWDVVGLCSLLIKQRLAVCWKREGLANRTISTHVSWKSRSSKLVKAVLLRHTRLINLPSLLFFPLLLTGKGWVKSKELAMLVCEPPCVGKHNWRRSVISITRLRSGKMMVMFLWQPDVPAQESVKADINTTRILLTGYWNLVHDSFPQSELSIVSGSQEQCGGQLRWSFLMENTTTAPGFGPVSCAKTEGIKTGSVSLEKLFFLCLLLSLFPNSTTFFKFGYFKLLLL